MSKYFVTYITEYPIYEPAEGGYYYAGTVIEQCLEFQTWKKANKVFQTWRKEFLATHADEMDRVNDHVCGGCGKWSNHPFVRYNAPYIGDGERIELTREKPIEYGYRPYC